jgi:endonuclease I
MNTIYTKKTTLLAILIACFTSSKIVAQPPANYYNSAVGKSCVALKTALSTITTTGMNPRAYGSLWTTYLTNDIKPRTVGVGSTNVIYDIYSSIPGGIDPYQFTPSTMQCGTYSNEGDCYNREHSVPQSWFNGNTSTPGPATDYLHIFPTDGKVNGKRNNDIYGEVATASFTSLNGSKLGTSSIAGITGNVFEPIDSFKGDVARAFLYFVTRYETDMPTFGTNADATRSFDANTFPSIKINYLKLMIKWHNQDPVSAREKARNNASYTFQGNRNPFIDHPEYVNAVWNATCPGLAILPVDIVLFSGKLDGNFINLNWQIANEINLSHYEVERSFNGENFSSIATVKATQKTNYSFTDNIENTRGRRIFYRLKKVENNGGFGYSEIFTVHIPLNIKYTVYPNPTKDFVVVNFNETISKTYNYFIKDIAGRLVANKQQTSNNGKLFIDVAKLQKGVYFLSIVFNNELLTSKVVVE